MILARTLQRVLTKGALFAISLGYAADTWPVIKDTNSRDLSLSHTLSRNTVTSGDTFILIFSLQNHDPNPAQDIHVQLDLPKELFIESYDLENGDFIEEQGIWKIQHLSGGFVVSLQLSILTSAEANISFSARISNATPVADPIAQNNETQGFIKVQEDCLIVFNDFSQTEKSQKRGLYADCATEYPNNFLQVFDRWGALVYEKENYDNSWTGKRHPKFTKFGREELLEGTYYYVLSFPESDRAEKTGWIYISE